MDTKKLRQKILDLAIHGQLVPQDPNDEPASVLLERIRAEKEQLIKEGKIKAPKKSKSAGDTSHYPKKGPWELPEGWEWCRLEDFVYAVTDGDHLPPPQSKSGIPFLVISDVNTGVINFDKARFVPDSYYDSLPTIRKASIHDILFTVTGSYGIVIPVETKERFCFQRHIGLIKTIESHEWLVFVLQSRYVQAYCDKVATGTAQKTVSLGALRDLPIPIPPRKEQERIGERLQEWLKISNHLGVAGAELNRNIVLAKTKILDFAIHGKLVPQDPSEEPAIEFLKRINPAFQPSHNLHYEGIVPAGWQLCQLSDLFKITMGQSPDGSSLNHKSGIEFHQGKICFTEKYLTESGIFTSCPTKCAEPNSLLCCVRAPVGVFNITTRRICIGRGLCSLSPLDLDVDIEYWFYALCSLTEYYEGKATGSTFKAISGDIIRNTVIAVPPKMEQKRICEQITRLFSVLKEVADTI